MVAFVNRRHSRSYSEVVEPIFRSCYEDGDEASGPARLYSEYPHFAVDGIGPDTRTLPYLHYACRMVHIHAVQGSVPCSPW